MVHIWDTLGDADYDLALCVHLANIYLQGRRYLELCLQWQAMGYWPRSLHRHVRTYTLP
jgi:hypothetical protein